MALNVALILHAALEEYVLPWDGDHGIAHWARVLENGLRLAGETGADVEVVRLFAVLHDSRRVSEATDPDHGPRAAEFARTLRGRLFDLADPDFRLLERACAGHTHERTHPDVTIRTCWDADRLDLGRVGDHAPPEPPLHSGCEEAGDDPVGRRQGEPRRRARVREDRMGDRPGGRSPGTAWGHLDERPLTLWRIPAKDRQFNDFPRGH
jgi:uncharacterized protein